MPIETGYWERSWTVARSGATRLKLTWDGGEAGALVYDEGVPNTAAGFIAALPIEVPIMHVAWSGDMVLTSRPIDIGVTEPENHVKNPLPGDLGFDPKMAEVTLTYGVAECHMPTGPNTIVIFGQIDENLDGFAHFARQRRYEGLGNLSIALA